MYSCLYKQNSRPCKAWRRDAHSLRTRPCQGSLCLHSSLAPLTPLRPVCTVLASRTLRGSVDILATARLRASSLSHGTFNLIRLDGLPGPPSSCTWANGELDIISTSRALPWRFVLISRRLVLARTIIGRASDRSSKDRLLILAVFNSHYCSLCANATRNVKLQGSDFLFSSSSPSLRSRFPLPRSLVTYRKPVLFLLIPAFTIRYCMISPP